MPKTKALAPDKKGLPDLTPQEMEFINYLMFDSTVGGDASKAYRLAFPDRSHNPTTVWSEASKLKNSHKVRTWIESIKLAQMDRLEDTREQYIADIKADIEEAKKAGNYGAAATLRVALGKVEGHHVERSETVTRKIDYANVLQALAPHLPKEALEGFKAKLGIEHKEPIKHIQASTDSQTVQ